MTPAFIIPILLDTYRMGIGRSAMQFQVTSNPRERAYITELIDGIKENFTDDLVRVTLDDGAVIQGLISFSRGPCSYPNNKDGGVLSFGEVRVWTALGELKLDALKIVSVSSSRFTLAPARPVAV
jgi:hypothetical protein